MRKENKWVTYIQWEKGRKAKKPKVSGYIELIIIATTILNVVLNT